MKRYILLILIFFCYSCEKHESKKIGLDKKLYQTLIEYQKKYPIPKKIISKRGSQPIYVYYAYFWLKAQDTILVFQRSSGGILKSEKGFGIYKDSQLMPTYIIDDKNLGNKFITKKIINKSNDEFYWKEKESFPESFPPVHTFLVKNKQLKLIKIDTVWTHWD